MRIVLAVLCVLAGTALGFYRSAALKKRELILSEIVLMLEAINVQIRYRALPAVELFESLSGNSFIDSVLLRIKSNNNPNWHNAWEEAVNGSAELNDEDVRLLKTLGSGLGASDAAGQAALLELNRELFSARLAGAAEESGRKGKMYRSVGVLVGLGLAVLVI